eukprot:3494955-Pyramimonas_sp.AAC.1
MRLASVGFFHFLVALSLASRCIALLYVVCSLPVLSSSPGLAIVIPIWCRYTIARSVGYLATVLSRR